MKYFVIFLYTWKWLVMVEAIQNILSNQVKFYVVSALLNYSIFAL